MTSRLRRRALRFVTAWGASFAFLVHAPGAIAAPPSASTPSVQADAHAPHGAASQHPSH